jgi:hypothetical protein
MKKDILKIKKTQDSNYYVLPGNDALKTGWRRLVTLVLSRYYICVQLISVLTITDTHRNVSSQFRTIFVEFSVYYE